MKTVELTDRELALLLDALAMHGHALKDSLVASGDPELADALTEVEDLEIDLCELLHRGDGWDRENDALPDAAAEFIQAGIDAREHQKATSRAATRREEMRSGKVANDPIDW